SLGATLAGTGQTNQPTVTIEAATALHLKPPSDSIRLVPTQNFAANGLGMDHPFGLINQMGAIENLIGMNTIPGNVTVSGELGIAAEQVFGKSRLYLTGTIDEKTAVINVGGTAQGGPQEDDKVIDTGATAGLISVTAQVYGVPDDVRIYLGDFKTNPSGAILVYDSTTNGNFQNPTNKNRATITVNYTNT